VTIETFAAFLHVEHFVARAADLQTDPFAAAGAQRSGGHLDVVALLAVSTPTGFSVCP
jgi:hypothetical protein